MDELRLQLSQMKDAISVASNEDKPGLQMMIDQLEQLLHESTQYQEIPPPTSPSPFSFNEVVSNSNLVDEDEEFRRFQEEISALSSDNGHRGSNGEGLAESEVEERKIDSADSDDETKNDIKDELSALEGMKCKAPFEHNWGQLGYYNAVVFNVESSNYDSLDTILVRVVFSQPIVNSMKPCPYFMEGQCKFDDDTCKFSHGEIVSLAHLKEYTDPDFSRIVTGSRVLAKYSDGLWYKGTITEVTDTGDCVLTYDSYVDNFTIPLHDTCPLYDDAEDDENVSDSSSASSSSSSSSDEDEDYIRMVQTSDSAFLNMKATTALGQWERYTKGIGSKLMEKMGYVIGTGLGKLGEGRVEPVDAIVLPRGRSLDTCMHLKEKAGQQSIFSAEKVLLRQQRKEEKRAQKEQEKINQAESMFNFLNTKLSLCKDKNLRKETVSTSELNKETCKNLNKKMLNLGENVKQVTRDISKLKDGIKRHKGRDQTTVDKMNAKLESLEKQLKQLKDSEVSIASEQQQRNDKKKLSIF